MGWIEGEWVEGVNCEDAPCCGCCGTPLGGSGTGYMVLIEAIYDDPASWDFED